MWILRRVQQDLQEIDIAPCTIDDKDERMGWATEDEACTAKRRYEDAMPNSKVSGPHEVPDDYRLYIGI
jgi:hypothetical protein